MKKRTYLFAKHEALGAHMIDFFGWIMPLHYGSQIEEHNAVRTKAGMFDVSHMTILDIIGAGGRQFLRKLLANDIDKLKHVGCAMYSCMCNEHGGIIDDLIVYQRASDNFRLVLNAGTKEHDLNWIRDKTEGFAVGLQERGDLGILAVQGPEALSLVNEVLDPGEYDAVSTLQPFESVEVKQTFFARTGYTGEDGLEIIMPEEELPIWWEKLLSVGVKPCGLGARDSLRLEAGYLLYGQDMDESTTPLESGLEWTVAWEPLDRDFIGMGALLSQKQTGVERKLVGLILEANGVMRAGCKVSNNKGIVTSGIYSPFLKKSIGLARVPAFINIGDEVFIEIRDKLLPAKVTKPRFLTRKK